MNKNRMAFDAVAMAVVRILSMCTGLIGTTILSRLLPLSEYGTYSTGNLITSTATSLSAFGLLDAVNYYYNGKDKKTRYKYVNTVFTIIMICGIIAASVIIVFSNNITAYFQNPKLTGIYFYIAFRPIMINLEVATRNLQLSIGKAKFIAVRNAFFSVFKLGILVFAACFTSNVDIIFALMLILETITVAVNIYVLEKNKVRIRINKSDIHKVKEILSFCLPMGIYLQANSLTQNMDAFVIGYFEPTEKLAIYTNCANRLPIDFMSSALLVVMIPTMTQYIQNKKYNQASDLLRCYTKIGYISSWSIGIACIMSASQAVRFLYGEKYIEGTPIFILYMIVDMLHFANFSLILSAKGKTKTLMYISCGSLFINLILNIAFYKIFGFIGPALATVLITLGTVIIMIKKSTMVLHSNICNIIDPNSISKFIVQMLISCIVTYSVKKILIDFECHYFLILAICGSVCTGLLIFANYKEIVNTFKKINAHGKSVENMVTE